MSLETLETLKQLKKWYDFVEEAKMIIEKTQDMAEVSNVYKLCKACIQRIHPVSICSLALVLIKKLSLEDSLDLLESSIKIIADINQEAYKQQLYSLQMRKYIVLIEKRCLQDIENQIYALKETYLSDENKDFLNYLAGVYYEKMGFLESALKYYVLYAKGIGKAHDIKELLRLAIVVEGFFDFPSIMCFNEYKNLQNDCDIKKIFTFFLDGKVGQLDEKLISSTLRIENTSLVKEKAFIYRILSICTDSEDRKVSFEQLLKVLGIEEIVLIELLVKALAYGCFKGWIDCAERVFYFSQVQVHLLKTTDIGKMKSRFVEWLSRVDAVIDTVESSLK